MKFNKKTITFFILMFPYILCAQAELIFHDIQMDESVETVAKKINEISEDFKLISVEEPSFPLAKNKEDHIICKNIKTDFGTISKAVFTFADDSLKYIEVRGNVNKVFTTSIIDTARTYLDYRVYASKKLFLKKKEDAAWILTQEAMHVNLFTWGNPYLNSNNNLNHAKYSNKLPAFIKMGATLEELRLVLEAKSKFTNIEKLDGTDPNAQLQINCFGIDYLGFPRKIEARFGDGILNMVWILTGKGEEDRVRKALINQFGNAVYVNEDWEIFNDWQVGLRKDKPEVLLIKKELGLQYKKSYFKQ